MNDWDSVAIWCILLLRGLYIRAYTLPAEKWVSIVLPRGFLRCKLSVYLVCACFVRRTVTASKWTLLSQHLPGLYSFLLFSTHASETSHPFAIMKVFSSLLVAVATLLVRLD